MAASVTHAFVSAKADGADASLVRPSNWNAGHVVTGVALTGKQCVPCAAASMTANTTNGPASGTLETTTNKVMFSTLDFDATTSESAQFAIAMPDSWDEGTVTFRPVWMHAATTTNFNVRWQLSGVAFSDDDAGDGTAFGTGQNSDDTGGTTNDVYIGPESSAVTIAGSPAAGDLVVFKVARIISGVSNNLAIDAKLIAIKLFLTMAAGNDE